MQKIDLGTVARVGESVERANKYGAYTIGITANKESYLGKSAKKTLDLDIPPFEPSPGVRSYLVSVLSLLLLAIRIGEVRGKYTMDVAMDYRKRGYLNSSRSFRRITTSYR